MEVKKEQGVVKLFSFGLRDLNLSLSSFFQINAFHSVKFFYHNDFNNNHSASVVFYFMQRGQRYDICPKARRYSTKNGKRGANSCFNKDHILDLSNEVLYVPEPQGATKLLVIRF